MRTTLTLDDDGAAKLEAKARRNGRPFRAVVNETLRRGLASQRITSRRPFEVETRGLGELTPGLPLDNVAALIEQVEGAAFR